MTHRLLQLVATQPQLLAEHAQAYAELLGAEIDRVSAGWKRQALLNGLALCGLGVAATLAGVALMLWAVLPAAHFREAWVLIVVPLLPLAAAAACLGAARRKSEGPAFDTLQQQLKADLDLLREASPG